MIAPLLSPLTDSHPWPTALAVADAQRRTGSIPAHLIGGSTPLAGRGVDCWRWSGDTR